MAHINLLPWREKKRKEQQQEYAFIVGGVAVLGALVWGLAHMQMESFIEGQQGRNSFLQREIASLNKEIEKIKDLESTKSKLLARMNVIQELQSNRPLSVHLMDELVRTIPDGVYLTALEQKGTLLTLEGKAESNARVSAYMRNIDNSLWLGNPRLEVIETEIIDRRRVAKFTLLATQKTPQAEGEDAMGGTP
ncbi:PilN domain-containing protein [Thiohalobacter sp. IOR34]|uniref:PilN domain-containing protein n=1 Tax=Thiohalobacter sp. IOR34 TaxID=3057176 RepID=UPI0025B0A153|nr:PilN domain-containing protein [Thiohalobacter sp. IOR34]WJW75688.1 PilN domain-containing protein [Thiohalobacter sp. IOR34]